MKKRILILIGLWAVLLFAFTLCACSGQSDTDTDHSNISNTPNAIEISITTAYAQATDLGFTGSLEEFIALISGEDGVDGVDGKDGRGITSVAVNADGELIITFTDNSSLNAGSVVLQCAHSYGSWQTSADATCTSLGYDTRVCSKCGDIDYRFTEQLGHDYGNTVTIIKEHCTETGLEVLTCSRCGDTQSKPIAPVGHGLSYPSLTCIYCGKSVDDINAEKNFNFSLIDDGTAYEVSGKNKDTEGELIIPFAYNGLPVTKIKRTGFYMYRKITKVVIPDGVTEIGQLAFCSCTALKTIVIPKTVTVIQQRAFSMNDFDNIQIDIENPVFQGNGNYIADMETKTLICGNSMGYIPDDGSVEHIGNYAFASIGSGNITIPEGIKTIGKCAFESYKDVKCLTLPSTVTSVSASAFSSVAVEESITVATANTAYKSIDNCLIEIASKTLIKGCNNSVIPTDGSVITIGASAFANCKRLTEITVPKSVTEIKSSAFYRSGLNKIILPDTLRVIEHNAFEDTPYYSDKDNWVDGALYIGKFLISTNSSLSEEYTIREGTIAIASYAFEHSSTKKLIITDSVKYIGSHAFHYSNLTDIEIGSGVQFMGAYAFNSSTVECVTFKDPTSWGRYTTITEYEHVSAEDLSNPENAAKLLKETIMVENSVFSYSIYSYTWYKSGVIV